MPCAGSVADTIRMISSWALLSQSGQRCGACLRTWHIWPEWNTDPLLNQANLVIGSPKYALVSVLKMDPKWKVVFDDGVAVVFERVRTAK